MAERTDLVVPELGESITEAVIARWLKSVGDAVEADEPILDLETDKITVQLPAPSDGALAEQRVEEGDTVKVGDVVGQIAEGAVEEAEEADEEAGEADEEAGEADEEAEEADEEAADEGEEEERPAPGGDGRPLTPAQRRAAREKAARQKDEANKEKKKKDEDKKKKKKKDEDGKEAVARDEKARRAERPAAEPVPPTAPRADAGAEREEAVPMSPMRKRIAERLVQAQRESASLTTFNEVDMSAVMELRSRFKQEFLDQHEVKLGFMSFFVKSCVAACKKFPGVNAEIRGDSIVYKHHYDFGIAVNTDRGLVVPVLRDCDTRSFAEVEQGIIELADRARSGKLTLDDLTGGTFSITNGGIYGSMLSTPLLNYPQTGILGMHNIVQRPVVVGDSVEVRPVMYLALTYDHRVVDGKQAVRFLVTVKEGLESPDRLMLDL